MSERDTPPEALPALPRDSQQSSNANPSQQLWLRLSAFLSLRAPNTRITYTGIFREWCEFLGAAFGSNDGAQRITQASDLHAIAFRNWLERRPGQRPRASRREPQFISPPSLRRARFAHKKSGLESTQSNATIAKKFAALRRIYRMLIASGLVTLNPFDSDRVPPPPKDSGRKRPTEMVSFQLVQSILSQPDPSHPKGARDRAILAVLFGAGLRRSEVCSLRIGDIRSSSAGTAFLYLRATKAKRDAEQALPDWATQAVLAVKAQRGIEGAGPADFLFVSYTGQGGSTPTTRPISPSGVYNLFRHYCQKAGASTFVSPHSARATAITRLLDQGIPHRLVQEFSRHSSIQMVELYDKRRIGVDQNPAKKLKY